MAKGINFTLFNVEVIPITAPKEVIESGSHVTVVGGMAYFFDSDGHEVHVSKNLKLAYRYEDTIILQCQRGELYHLVVKKEKTEAPKKEAPIKLIKKTDNSTSVEEI